MFRKLLCLILLITILSETQAQKKNKAAWVDSTYNALNEDQRLGQLFMMRAFSNTDRSHIDNVKKVIEKFQNEINAMYQE